MEITVGVSGPNNQFVNFITVMHDLYFLSSHTCCSCCRSDHDMYAKRTLAFFCVMLPRIQTVKGKNCLDHGLLEWSKYSPGPFLFEITLSVCEGGESGVRTGEGDKRKKEEEKNKKKRERKGDFRGREGNGKLVRGFE